MAAIAAHELRATSVSGTLTRFGGSKVGTAHTTSGKQAATRRRGAGSCSAGPPGPVRARGWVRGVGRLARDGSGRTIFGFWLALLTLKCPGAALLQVAQSSTRAATAHSLNRHSRKAPSSPRRRPATRRSSGPEATGLRRRRTRRRRVQKTPSNRRAGTRPDPAAAPVPPWRAVLAARGQTSSAEPTRATRIAKR
jgi:hypothetical protein